MDGATGSANEKTTYRHVNHHIVSLIEKEKESQMDTGSTAQKSTDMRDTYEDPLSSGEGTSTMRDVYVKFGTMLRGSAELGLYWSPLTEKNVLIAEEGEDADRIQQALEALYGYVEEAADHPLQYRVEALDFTDCDEDSEEVYQELERLKEIALETEEYCQNAEDDSSVYFIVINGFDVLSETHRNDEEKLRGLDNILHLLEHSADHYVYVLVGVEDASSVPSFLNSFFGLQIYCGESNMQAAEKRYGVVENYDPAKHEGIVKTYINDALVPVSSFFDDIA